MANEYDPSLAQSLCCIIRFKVYDLQTIAWWLRTGCREPPHTHGIIWIPKWSDLRVAHLVYDRQRMSLWANMDE